jgi:hypothetical protein
MPESDETTENGTFTQPMALEVSEGAQYPLKPSFDDARGIERVAGPALETWKPAQVEPTAEEIAHHAEFLVRDDEARQVRLGALGLSEHVNTPPHSALDQADQGTLTPEAPEEGVTPEEPVTTTDDATVDNTAVDTSSATVAE